MPSPALTGYLLQFLADADHLAIAKGQLPIGLPDRPALRAAINRAMVVVCLSAWEAELTN